MSTVSRWVVGGVVRKHIHSIVRGGLSSRSRLVVRRISCASVLALMLVTPKPASASWQFVSPPTGTGSDEWSGSNQFTYTVPLTSPNTFSGGSPNGVSVDGMGYYTGCPTCWDQKDGTVTVTMRFNWVAGPGEPAQPNAPMKALVGVISHLYLTTKAYMDSNLNLGSASATGTFWTDLVAAPGNCRTETLNSSGTTTTTNTDNPWFVCVPWEVAPGDAQQDGMGVYYVEKTFYLHRLVTVTETGGAASANAYFVPWLVQLADPNTEINPTPPNTGNRFCFRIDDAQSPDFAYLDFPCLTIARHGDGYAWDIAPHLTWDISRSWSSLLPGDAFGSQAPEGGIQPHSKFRSETYNHWGRVYGRDNYLPDNNSDFGAVGVTLRQYAGGTSGISGDGLVFFPGTDTHHPDPGHGTVPNWFYYYSQVYAPGGTYESGGSYTDLTTTPSTIHIGDEGHGGFYGHYLFYRDPDTLMIALRDDDFIYTRGIETFVWIVAHEHAHKDQHDSLYWLVTSPGDPGDADPPDMLGQSAGDGVRDTSEELVGLDPTNKDTTDLRRYLAVGDPHIGYEDREVLAEIIAYGELQAQTGAEIWRQDWASDGIQYSCGSIAQFPNYYRWTGTSSVCHNGDHLNTLP